jgi:hypothetical protein
MHPSSHSPFPPIVPIGDGPGSVRQSPLTTDRPEGHPSQ